MTTAGGPTGRAPSPEVSGVIRAVRVGLLLVLLYAFLVGVDLLGTGIAGLGEEFTDRLFRGVGNPLAGLAVGILATVLAQSSSVTTATIVGLVGAGVLSVHDAVPMIMGANIGTTVTNTLASVGSIRRPEEFRRAFAGATMHDFFNVASVVILLPIEVVTGVLARLAVELSDLVGDASGGEFNSPVQEGVQAGAGVVESAAAALVGPPRVAAALLLATGLGLLFGTLVAITKNMRVVMAGPAERSLNAVLGRSGVLGILVGALLTVSVQSSSISTSLLIPMIAAGVLRLENAYPVTLGANLGTTITALLAALAIPQIAGLQIALVHLLFNLTGILIFYPIPLLRRLPLRASRKMADLAVARRTMVLVYVILLFLVLPLGVIVIVR
ncbi:MAG TPA: Na/Pi symporter [Egibacteraceae bacterium]|nr:Na/Pi symporter [Egibacteraceae bacterium]